MKSVLNRIWKSIQRPCFEFAQKSLYLRPELFNGIRIGTISLKPWISIALTTETKKPASFNVSAIGLQYVLVCSITIRISTPSFLSVDVSFFQVTVRVVNIERPKYDFASGPPYRNGAFALRYIDTDGGNNSSFHFSDLL